MTTTGLSRTAREYRERLEQQSDEQIDAWAAELMRDMSIRRGVRSVLKELMHAAKLDEATLEAVYAAGGGPPSTFGRAPDGTPMVPAIALHAFVTGLRARFPDDAREKLIAYLVANFEELVYL